MRLRLRIAIVFWWLLLLARGWMVSLLSPRSTPRLQATIQGIAAAGISEQEVKMIHQAFVFGCQDQEVSFSLDNLILLPPADAGVIGSTGRVLLLQCTNDMSDEEIQDLSVSISCEMDDLIYAGLLSQPILLSLEQKVPSVSRHHDYLPHLCQCVAQHVQKYELAVPLPRRESPRETVRSMKPTMYMTVDGATITTSTGQELWDTSAIVVFDNLVSPDLRKRLRHVVLGDHEDWDHESSPNPRRWVRGGLMDTPDQQQEDDTLPCWGLTDEAMDELCLHHDAFQEFESTLSELFSDFSVCRLPQAVYGDSVSPLTANAPTLGDVFDPHIDADPYSCPPSPWTDVYGRYPNRQPGKPRFVSCLVYLNDEWKEEWGAPTRVWDVSTDTAWNVVPRPGRCVMMDQDVTHSVVAPTVPHRPRYSLVWKLILHPKKVDESVGFPRHWGEPTCLGSAVRDKVVKR
jgi:hypothetical protein